MTKVFAVAALIAGCATSASGGPEERATTGGAAGIGGAPAAGGAARVNGGESATTAGVGGLLAASGGAQALGGQTSAGGAPSGERCDYIESCRSVVDPCSAVLSVTCGKTRAGTFGCGNVTGWFTDDGQSFLCAESDSGAALDCTDALGAFSRYCSSLSSQ